MLENKEIRNLKEADLYNVVCILDVNDDWKRFMSLIPRDPQKKNSDRKYNNEHITMIEDHAKVTGEKCAKILFDEWGTSGEIRPTLKTLQEIALQADMMRVADEIARLLGEDPPPRPQRGPGAPVLNDLSVLANDTSMEIRDTTAQMKSENSNNHLQSQSTGQLSNLPNWEIIHNQNNYPIFDNQQSGSQQSSSQGSNNQTSIQQGSSNQQINNYQYDQQSNDQQSTQQPINYSQSNAQQSYQQSLPNIPIFLSVTDNVSLSSRIDKSILQDINLIHFDYHKLQDATNNFSDHFKIGSGGFGDVFKAPYPSHGLLAIKRTKLQIQHNPEVVIRIFNSEVKYLSQFRHENIVPILGFSKNGPVPCIVCEYIEGGSLYDKITEGTLSERQRINIMRGTAEGLSYLHRYTVDRLSASATDPSVQSISKTNFVHGDVKSANILLTKDYIPKLCDFGLAKQYDHTFITPNVMGTSAYMAPDALQGTVTQKSDVYSYGIVLLELLTGLRPLVLVNEEPGKEQAQGAVQHRVQIKQHIDACIKRQGMKIEDLLDSSAGQWTRAGELFALVNRCCEYDRHDRPSSEDICNILRALDDK